MKSVPLARDAGAAAGQTLLSPRVLALMLLGLAAALALINLPYSPRTWYDEGSHLHVPKTLVQDGVYADKSAEGYRFYGPTVGVGPTVMLPIALSLKLFGVGLAQGRAVIVVYLLLALLLFYLAARRMHGAWVGAVTLALLVGSRTVGYGGMIEYGRQVLGEVPGLAFLAAGLIAWAAALQAQADVSGAAGRRRQLLLCALSGLGFGLALLTKNQFVLIIPPALFLTAALDWLYYRAASWQLRIVPLAVACACFGLLTFLQFQFLGAGTFMKTVEETRKAAGGAIFVFDRTATVRAVRYLVRPDLYGGLLLPGLAYTLWRARRRGAAGLSDALVGAVVGLWLAWYVGASLGWPRYAFPAVVFGAIGSARLAVDLFTWLRARRAWAAFALAAYVAVAVAVPVGLTANDIMHPDDSAQRFAAVMDSRVPRGALVATWEQELGFLTDHRYQYPPQSLLADAVQREWFGGGPLQYDWESARPDFVVQGPFSDYAGIFGGPQLERDYALVDQAGPYKLFRRTAP